MNTEPRMIRRVIRLVKSMHKGTHAAAIRAEDSLVRYAGSSQELAWLLKDIASGHYGQDAQKAYKDATSWNPGPVGAIYFGTVTA